MNPQAVRVLKKLLDDYESGKETSKGDPLVPATVARQAADSVLDRFLGKAPAAPEDRDAAARGVLSLLSKEEFFRALEEASGRRIVQNDDDPLAIPATTEE
jgi:MoxR-like ATPase